MRLIDADLLMENYDLKSATKYGNKTAKQQVHSYSTLMMYEVADMIEDAPIAYDVDAVVNELDKIKAKPTELVYDVPLIESIIEIVRKGGKK